jgi:catechol 2,3-dioxygenase-like lactoylglutathione lyase family enzyme
MFFGIDHLVVLVSSLEDAIERYRSLNFRVLPGGAHPVGTHNALITFEDGSYIELIAFQDPSKPHDHRWYPFLDRTGLVDYAVRVENVDEELHRIRHAGLDYQGPLPGARKRPDGVQLNWRTAPPQNDRTGELPFLIDDITDRSLRIPGGADAVQPNGVTGIRRLVVAVRDLGEATEFYQTLLAGDPVRDRDHELQADIAQFQCGSHEIVLAYPISPSSPLVQQIQRRGDGPFQATLTVPAGAEIPELPSETAEGVRFVVEHEDQHE